MVRIAISVTVFLFLLTFSRARDLPNPFSESEPASEKIHEPETTTRFQSSESRQHDTVSLTIDSVDPVPLTLLKFRPINRHIHPRRSLPFPLSLAHRRCRHGNRREIPYGKDMIFLSDDASKTPIRWSRIQEARQRFPEMMAQPHHFRHHGHSQHHHHHEKGWFAKRFSNFLNLF